MRESCAGPTPRWKPASGGAAQSQTWRLEWKRQVPRGNYIVDFLCTEAQLVVELDGGQHAEQIAYDARRTTYLENLGYRVLRIWNHSVLEDASGVCDTILAACGGETPHLTSPRKRGEE